MCEILQNLRGLDIGNIDTNVCKDTYTRWNTRDESCMIHTLLHRSKFRFANNQLQFA